MIPRFPRSTLIAAIAVLAHATPGAARPSVPQESVRGTDAPGRPRVGLALSGGSARGFAHVGVIEALESAGVPIHVVAGTSMGSVVGGLYASGLSTAEIRAVAAGVDWDRMFSDLPDRRNLPIERKSEEGRTLFALPIVDGAPRLPSGIIEGQRITQLLTGLTWHVHHVRDFRDLPVPFAAVATDAETGEPVVLEAGFLPDAIRASLAIPSVFAPVEVDGRYLVDGGIVRNLPSAEARALGADIVICSDVTKPLVPADSLRTLVDVLTQTMAFRTVERRDEDARLCDVLIRPEIRGIESADFGRADEIIARGTTAAEVALERMRALGLTGLVPRGPAPALDPLSQHARVTGIRVLGLERSSEASVLRNLGIETPGDVDVPTVDAAISRVYDTGLFEQVSYRLVPEPVTLDPADPDRVLLVEVRDQGRSWVGGGYRYEGRYKASILGTASVRNLLLRGSTLLADVRLGEQTRASATLQKRFGWDVAPVVGLEGQYRRSPFDLYVEGERVAEPRVKSGSLAAFLGLGLGYSARVGAKLAVEGVESDRAELVPDWSGGSRTYLSLAAVAEADTRDRLAFPHSGIRATARAGWGDGSPAEDGGGFAQQLADVDAAIPLGTTVAVRLRAAVGSSQGAELPSQNLFFAGGANPYYLYPDRHFSFAGQRVMEQRGRHLQLLALGLQWEVVPGMFVFGRWNAVALPDEWRLDASDFITGFGAGVGLDSRLGTAQVVVTGGSEADAVRVEVDFGYRF